jgi:6,7-dimethyl-8-ribityllumazine synthase
MSNTGKSSGENNDKFLSARERKIAIIVSDWHKEITGLLLDGAVKTLIKYGANNDDIIIRHVPGSFELISAAHMVVYNLAVDAVICIGCIVKGETDHYNYICQGVTQGLAQLNVDADVPVIYCILTTNTVQQAMERAGGKYGNKGEDAAITALKMADLSDELFILGESQNIEDLGFDDDIDYYDEGLN